MKIAHPKQRFGNNVLDNLLNQIINAINALIDKASAAQAGVNDGTFPVLNDSQDVSVRAGKFYGYSSGRIADADPAVSDFIVLAESPAAPGQIFRARRVGVTRVLLAPSDTISSNGAPAWLGDGVATVTDPTSTRGIFVGWFKRTTVVDGWADIHLAIHKPEDNTPL